MIITTGVIRETLQKAVICGVLSLSLFIVNTTSIAQTSDLPELGDSATRFLNPAQEKQIGQQFYRQLLASPLYLEDYELKDYLQSMGDRIAAAANLRGTPLTFSLIRNNALNAFAVPGGFITFHTGLLMATETESELASVAGHEIAHLTQRHLPRMIARANENKIPTIAAIIGSILLGGQAGLAGLTMTNATLASNQLSYTRGFEREADAIGIQLLAKAQYDPTAMATFFGSLERYTRHDSTEIPEFLRTHPLSYSRVAESEARASEYPPRPHESSFEFYLAKARIEAFYTERRDDPLLFFKDQMASEKIHIQDAATYGKAIIFAKSRDYASARTVLQPLGERYPDHPWIQSAFAEIDLADEKYPEAISKYEALITRNPNVAYLHYKLANA
jgi:predicted Zn-dependent protease